MTSWSHGQPTAYRTGWLDGSRVGSSGQLRVNQGEGRRLRARAGQARASRHPCLSLPCDQCPPFTLRAALSMKLVNTLTS